MATLALPPPPEKVEQLQQFYKIHDITLIPEALRTNLIYQQKKQDMYQLVFIILVYY